MQSKKITALFISTLVLAVFSSLFFTAFAQEPASTNENPLTADEQTRVVNLAANMSNKIDAATYRFEEISARVFSRVKKMEAEQYDMGLVWPHLQASAASIENIKAQMQGMDFFAVVIQSEDPAAAWTETREKYLAAAVELGKVKQSLQSAVTEMKASLLKGKNPVAVPEESPVMQ